MAKIIAGCSAAKLSDEVWIDFLYTQADGDMLVSLRRTCKRFDKLYHFVKLQWFSAACKEYNFYFGTNDEWTFQIWEKKYALSRKIQAGEIYISVIGGSRRDRTSECPLISIFGVTERDQHPHAHLDLGFTDENNLRPLLAVGRSALAAVYDWKRDSAFAIGGWTSEVQAPGASAKTDVDIFNTKTWCRTIGPKLQRARCFHGACMDSNSNIIVLGGATSLFQGATTYDSMEILRLGQPVETLTWDDTVSAKMCKVRAGHATIYDSSRNRIYAVGGYGGDEIYHNSLEWIDLSDERLTRDDGFVLCDQNMSVKRTGLGASIGPDYSLYVIGGSPDGAHGHNSLERYDPREGHWEPLEPMRVKRGYLSAVFSADGKLWVAGGSALVTTPNGQFNFEAYYDVIEVYDPRSNSWFQGGVLEEPLADLSLVSWTA